jgi:hypothetical protein
MFMWLRWTNCLSVLFENHERTQVGKAVANVHATYAVLVEPFRHELPDKDVKDYLEACAMGWKPERNLQQEFIGWLSAHLDESDKFNTVTVRIGKSRCYDHTCFMFKCAISPWTRCRSVRKILMRSLIGSNDCCLRFQIPLTV